MNISVSLMPTLPISQTTMSISLAIILIGYFLIFAIIIKQSIMKRRHNKIETKNTELKLENFDTIKEAINNKPDFVSMESVLEDKILKA